MADQPELLRFLTDLNQEVRTLADMEADEAGASLEEKATEYLTGLLADAGETENVRVCTSIRHNRARQIQHKINGYVLSENLEEVTLFTTFFQEGSEVRSFTREEVTRAANQSERFLKNMYNRYHDEIDESEPVFELAQLLAEHGQALVRARIFILTNARLTSDLEVPARTLGKAAVQYQVWDLDRFYRLWSSTSRREPVELDFTKLTGQPLACLPMPVVNEDYQSCLAVVSGTLLAALYAEHGARLLEQNVRSFLDFTGPVNQGIRRTIRTEPHRFLAYNNGIAATAAAADIRRLPEGGWGILRLTDLQIVNGGQTTAAIFRTWHQENADISSVFVQMKLTVLRRLEEVEEMVPLISRYANIQNGIHPADLSANNGFNRQLEKISRSCWAPAVPPSTAQTRWFFERARGQYKVAINREVSSARQKAFRYQNPREQLFTKEMVARMEHMWAGLPWMVARGAQKNYTEFFKRKTTGKKTIEYLPDTVFFEDLIAKILLFQVADREYGRGASKIGDYKFLTVPYTLAWLNQLTSGKLDLERIWKQQTVSEAVRAVIRKMLPVVDRFLLKNAGNRLVSERAKQEDCWRDLVASPLPADIGQVLYGQLTDDLTDITDGRQRRSQTTDELAAEERRQEEEALRGLGPAAWEAIEVWGRETGELSPHKRDRCNSIARSIAKGRPLTEGELETGRGVVDLLLAQHPQLLEDFYAQRTEEPVTTVASVEYPVTPALLDALFHWEQKNRALQVRDVEFIRTVMRQPGQLGAFKAARARNIVDKAVQRGFSRPLSG